MGSTSAVAAAAVAFVGSHFVLSHPLRRRLVSTIGETGFLGVYSLVAFATLGWLIAAYLKAPLTAPLWQAGDGVWAVATVIMLIASILLMGSLIRNPALPTGGRPAAFPAAALGVYAVTRHPMMWSFVLWGLCHIAVFPVAKSNIVAAAIVILALVGAALQDRKKEQLQPDLWPEWESKTSYLPFAAIAAGRARLGGFGLHALLGGFVMWLVATWAHMPLTGWAAGIWRWL
ncbi:NnrU family protein [Paraburkholderia sp. SEWSISQ10-3 4]|uniref:NnrU family protein n=1 Tax=Paraburkholderia TaxID=1822464 RepID=UPI00225303E8|nr:MULTISPECIES: NnrU family protein [Paraburkholderia]MCX4138842.1 NnrU family protein [Paraburkholderia aspalathi]MDN7171532.1 NnrU family protein [Paraburkholderia sp. SEWSISQ10-3 4]MDQ6501171.1 NnrU family protein [Paraburkholderia aspalathi]